jgi:hypothetical protein
VLPIRRGSSATRHGLVPITLFVAVGAICTACVPLAPNEQPLFMGIREEQVAFAWCGNDPLIDSYMIIKYALIGAKRTDHVAAEGEGSFILARSQEFSIASPPPGLTFGVTRDIPIGHDHTFVFVHAGKSSNDYDFRAQYEVSDGFAALKEGYWMDPTGKLARDPCAKS